MSREERKRFTQSVASNNNRFVHFFQHFYFLHFFKTDIFIRFVLFYALFLYRCPFVGVVTSNTGTRDAWLPILTVFAFIVVVNIKQIMPLVGNWTIVHSVRCSLWLWGHESSAWGMQRIYAIWILSNCTHDQRMTSFCRLMFFESFI